MRTLAIHLQRLLAVLGLSLMILTTLPAVSHAASVIVQWTAPGDDGNTGTAAEYDIRYSTSSITPGNWNQATEVTGEPAPQVAGTAESFTITGLADNTTYFIAIKTADEAANWSGLSNVAQVTTADATAPAAIVDLSAGSSP